MCGRNIRTRYPKLHQRHLRRNSRKGCLVIVSFAHPILGNEVGKDEMILRSGIKYGLRFKAASR